MRNYGVYIQCHECVLCYTIYGHTVSEMCKSMAMYFWTLCRTLCPPFHDPAEHLIAVCVCIASRRTSFAQPPTLPGGTSMVWRFAGWVAGLVNDSTTNNHQHHLLLLLLLLRVPMRSHKTVYIIAPLLLLLLLLWLLPVLCQRLAAHVVAGIY